MSISSNNYWIQLCTKHIGNKYSLETWHKLVYIQQEEVITKDRIYTVLVIYCNAKKEMIIMTLIHLPRYSSAGKSSICNTHPYDF